MPCTVMTTWRLFAVDIDGTLCTRGNDIPPEAVASLKKCIRAGIAIVPSTGKGFSNIKTLCETIGIEGPAVTCNGALVLHSRTQEVLFSHFMERSLFTRVLSGLGNDGLDDIAVFTDQDIVCTGINLASEVLSSVNEPTTRLVGSLLSLESERIAKILLAFDDKESLEHAHEVYSREYGRECTVAITSEKFLEFMAPAASKGNAIVDLARELRIPRENIACMGDSDNDLSMFDVAGLRIAVANASDNVLRAADIVVPTASQGGVTRAVEYLFEDG